MIARPLGTGSPCSGATIICNCHPPRAGAVPHRQGPPADPGRKPAARVDGRNWMTGRTVVLVSVGHCLAWLGGSPSAPWPGTSHTAHRSRPRTRRWTALPRRLYGQILRQGLEAGAGPERLPSSSPRQPTITASGLLAKMQGQPLSRLFERHKRSRHRSRLRRLRGHPVPRPQPSMRVTTRPFG